MSQQDNPKDRKSGAGYGGIHVVGDIVRYNPSISTSLMRISYIHVMWRGSKFEARRYYGQHYFGGLVRAEAHVCRPATYLEKEAWFNEGRRKTADKKRLLRVSWEMFSGKYKNAASVGAEN